MMLIVLREKSLIEELPSNIHVAQAAMNVHIWE